MNEFCPACTRPLASAQFERRNVGPIAFCNDRCMVRWFEDPRHDRRRENRNVAVNRRVRTPLTESLDARWRMSG